MTKKNSRRLFLAGIVGAGATGTLGILMKQASKLPATDRMPAAFIGHGTPRSAVSQNQWTASWEAFGKRIPKPAAVLSISAHWLTRGGALVTANAKPRMNYDFYGFPDDMYQVVYPAPGSEELAGQVKTVMNGKQEMHDDSQWG